MDYNTPRTQTDIDKITDVNEVAFSKLQIGQSNLKEEPIEVTDALVPPPSTKIPRDMTGKNDGKELSETERKLQQDKRNTTYTKESYVRQLSEEVESGHRVR